jgi:hypothetical protein
MGYFNKISNIKVVRNIDYKAVHQFKEQLFIKNYSQNCSKKESDSHNKKEEANQRNQLG